LNIDKQTVNKVDNALTTCNQLMLLQC